MTKNIMAKQKREFEEIVRTAAPEKLEKIKFVVEYISNATPDEMNAFREQMEQKDFSADAWYKTQKALQSSATSEKEGVLK